MRAAAFCLLLSAASPALAFETQADLNRAACDEAAAADADMQRLVGKMVRHARDEQIAARITAAQRAWEAFRDAQMALLHPDDGKSRGSVEPMCRCYERAALTRARTKQLRDMLRPMEGDVCGWTP